MYLRMFNPLACVFFIALSTTILILLILAVSLLISAYIFFLDWTSFHVDNLLIPGVLDFLLWLVDLFAFTLCRFVVCYSFLMTFFFLLSVPFFLWQSFFCTMISASLFRFVISFGKASNSLSLSFGDLAVFGWPEIVVSGQRPPFVVTNLIYYVSE